MTLRGSDFIANTRLTDLAGAVLAAVGDTCERVPVSSLDWLEEQGLVRRAKRGRESKRESFPVGEDDPGGASVTPAEGKE